MTRDEWGIIGQVQPGGWVEGGDSASWMGHYLAMASDEQWRPDTFICHFEVESGVWVRHPEKRDGSYAWFHNGLYDCKKCCVFGLGGAEIAIWLEFIKSICL